MSFEELVTAVWRNRVRVFIGLVAFAAILFGLLFVFVAAFQAMVISILMGFVQTVFIGLILLLGASMLWKAAMGNFKGGSNPKKK